MSVSFVYLVYLWLIALIPIAIGIALLSPQRANRWRFWIGQTLRAFILTALIFSLAGIQLRLDSESLTTVFILDASDSVSPEEQIRGENFIREAIENMGANEANRAAIIVFGENALVERLSSEENRFAEITSIPITSRTDISSALQLAQAVFPGEGAKRMVLLSDGRENLGEAIEQAELAATSQIELSYVPLGEQPQDVEVWLESLKAPSEIRAGQDFDLDVVVGSTAVQDFSLRIFEENRLVQTLEFRAIPGMNRIQVPMTGQGEAQSDEQGNFRRFRVQVLPDTDSNLQNNEASAFTIVRGSPTILVIEGEEGNGNNLVAALEAASLKVRQTSPEDTPTTLGELANFEAVVLVDTPAKALPPGLMDVLQVYVRDLGKGLVVIGGPQSYGAGGYIRTKLEEILPVDMDVRDKEIQSNLALILAVDKSGSMDRCHCDNPDLNQSYTPQLTGQPKVDIAKEAVMRAAQALGRQDYLGVLAFDSQPRWALELEQSVDPLSLERSIGAIHAEGQTNLEAGVEEAYRALQNVQARRKHIILMTDGWVHQGDLTTLAQNMRVQGVTLSIVAAGEGSAEYLAALAQLGGGEFYPATNIQSVPDIFLKETIKSIGKYIIEEPFYPLPASPSPVLRGLDGANLPLLLGYNGTSLKKTARLDLITPKGDPLLASWQYGLGRSVVWTSDMKGQWAHDWLAWEGFPRFASQLVSWTLPAERIEGLSMEAHLEENQAVIQVHATRKDGSPYNFLTGKATFVDPELEIREIPLKQVGAGEYQAIAGISRPGVYLIRAGMNDGDQSLGQTTLGLIVPYSPEYKYQAVDQGLLARLATITGGSEIGTENPGAAFIRGDLPSVPSVREIWMALLLIAAILFPMDVAVRRVALKKRDFVQAVAWLKSLLPTHEREIPPQPRLLDNLFDARQRVRHQREQNEDTPMRIPHPEGKIPDSKKTTRKVGIEDGPPVDKAQPDEQAAGDDRLSRLREAKKRARR